MNSPTEAAHVVRWASARQQGPAFALHPDVSSFKNIAVELYVTGDAFYIFDANRVVFLDVDERVHAILKLLRDEKLGDEEIIRRLPAYSERSLRGALEEIGRLRKMGFLQPARTRRHSDLDRAQFENTLTRRMTGMTVHVTTRCNLACSYCIFGGDYERHPELTQTAMTWVTARNMVDFLVARSGDSRRVRLDFFGGEPLLAFPLIRKTVDYLKERLRHDPREVDITIASNGTVLSDAILTFLVDHRVYLQFSVDGSRGAHDRERRFKSVDRGSYDLILRNLQRIQDHDASYFQQYIRIKSVITLDSLGDADDGFWNHPLIRGILEEHHEALLIEEPNYDIERDGRYFECLEELAWTLSSREGVSTVEELTRCLNWRQKAFFDLNFGRFMEVQAVNQLRRDVDLLPFTKTCLMGCQEGAVQPNGDIAVCHKASAVVIGNVDDGSWDLDRIASLHDRLHYDWPECTSCFAARFCDLCYEKLDGNDVRWNRTRSAFCAFNRQKHHLIFSSMLKILDRNPALWDDMRATVRKGLARKHLAVMERET